MKEPDEVDWERWKQRHPTQTPSYTAGPTRNMIRSRTRRRCKSFRQGLALEKKPRKKKVPSPEELLAQIEELDRQLKALGVDQ